MSLAEAQEFVYMVGKELERAKESSNEQGKIWIMVDMAMMLKLAEEFIKSQKEEEEKTP